MSKFYYSGSLEQVNFLTGRDKFLQSLYGKWQPMMIEGIALILFGLATIGYQAFDLRTMFQLPQYTVSYAFAALVLFMALIFLITYFVVKKAGILTILKGRSIFDVLACLFLIVFPNSLYGALGSASIFLGLSLILNKQNRQFLMKFLGIILLVIGIGLLFTNSYSHLYVNYLLAALFIGIGGIVTYYAVKFRGSISRYEDEQKGFTDFTIE